VRCVVVVLYVGAAALETRLCYGVLPLAARAAESVDSLGSQPRDWSVCVAAVSVFTQFTNFPLLNEKTELLLVAPFFFLGIADNLLGFRHIVWSPDATFLVWS
jgi:hypothetical protein